MSWIPLVEDATFHLVLDLRDHDSDLPGGKCSVISEPRERRNPMADIPGLEEAVEFA